MTDRGSPAGESTRDTYYGRVRDWADDRERRLATSLRLAWTIVSVAVGIAMLEAVALALLSPLKESVPYVVLVDRHTGYAQVLKGADRSAIAPDVALTQSLLAQYVTAREGFDIGSIAIDYRKVALWSADRAAKDYLASMPASNPASPLRRIPRTSIVRVNVKSVSPMQKGVALVRFDAERVDQGETLGGTKQSWVALITFRYVNAPMRFEDRLLNPLGFQVVRYRKDQEALPVQQILPQGAPVALIGSINAATDSAPDSVRTGSAQP